MVKPLSLTAAVHPGVDRHVDDDRIQIAAALRQGIRHAGEDQGQLGVTDRRHPFIQPAAGGTYWVSGLLRTQTVGPALTAQDAIVMVVQRLPAGCGPAFPGAPEELAAHEAAARKQ
ncbi:DUF6193 family natural product biosynthesis protein [Streptomyces sp. NPDC057620]|uniref:DUF6193 family natural product biosynthesis protein n=1 Tax=Streptomyces sp. NPDC057620 TaxID=3346185 RepID=UPI0036CEF233